MRSVSLEILMWSLKATRIPWLDKSGFSVCVAASILARIVVWLFNVVVSSITSRYYVTTLSHTLEVRFYERELWREMTSLRIAVMCASGQIEEIRDIASHSESVLGIGRGSFIPKEGDSARLIINLSKGSETTPSGYTVNQALVVASDVLQALVYYHPQAAGCTVRSQVEACCVLRQFHEYRKLKGDCRPLYFAKVDIEKCYDSILQV